MSANTQGRGGADNNNNQRGGGRGGNNNQGGGGRGGSDNQRGGARGGYDNQRGGGRGGYDNQRGGGRGGYDNQRGGGRGGYDNQRGGGRGRGGGGGQDCRGREKAAIDLQTKGFDAPLEMVTNQVKLTIGTNKTFNLYTISYEFKENAVDDGQDSWKEIAMAEFLRKIGESNPEYKAAAEQAVYTGQEVLSPSPLPADAEWDFKLKVKARKGEMITRVYGMRLRLVAENKKLALPADSVWVNQIIGKAVQQVYGAKIGERYIDMSVRHPQEEGIITMDAVIPKAMRVKVDTQVIDVLQVDVAFAVGASAANNCDVLIQRLQAKPHDAKRAVDELLVGRRVATTYGNAVLKVKQVLWDQTAASAAGLKKDPDMTYQTYFKNKYNLSIKGSGRILLCKHVEGGGRPAAFPAELLQPMFLDDKQTSRLPFICSIYPKERFQRVEEAVKRLLASQGCVAILNAFGLSVAPGLLRVKGEVVRAPVVSVPTKTGFSQINAAAPENLGQGGFAQKLGALYHPTQTPFAQKLIVDKAMPKAVTDALKQFNAPLPAPTLYTFQNVKGVKEDKSLNNATAFVMVKLPEIAKEPYESYKSEFARRGMVSQMVARHPDRTIPFAIAQQVCAKTGSLNTVVDPSTVAPTLTNRGNKDLLIIGIDVGSNANQRTDIVSHKSVREQNYTVAFVAFHVRGRSWKTCCNHCQVKGGTIVLHASGNDTDTASSAPSEVARRENPSEVLENRFAGFLKDALKEFGIDGAKSNGSVVVFRGSPSEGEAMRSGVLQHDLKAAMPNWDYAVLVAQARSHTRFGWHTPSAPAGEYCNAPRGFCTFEAADTFFTDDSKKTARAFSLVGANCTLGHASNTLYVITAKSSDAKMPEKEVVALTYAMCYLYPNKADALPVPLPMKCAAEYARKFSCLPSVKLVPKSMRMSMHYL